MRTIKRQILISVHYLVEAVNDEFWDKDTGYLNKEIGDSLKKQFPKQVKLADDIYAQQYSLWHEQIDHPNANLMQCPVCNRFITDPTKPKPRYRLDEGKECNGVMMCSSCAWELSFDPKKHRIISGKPPMPVGAVLINEKTDEDQ